MVDIFYYAVILIISRIVSEIFVRIKLPTVIGIILAGILCGPVFHIIKPTETINFLAEIGILFLLFIAGLETNIDHMKEQGKSSIVGAILGVFVPFGMSFLLMFLHYEFSSIYMIGLILTATSVSITVMTLIELKALNTRSGITVLGAAVIDDVIAIVFMTISMIFLLHEGNLIITLLKLAGFFVFVMIYYIFISTFVLRVSRRLRTNEAVLGMAVVLMMLMGVFSNSLGIAAITGAYIAGVAIAKTKFRRRVIEKISVITDAMFVSVFFFVIGLKTTINFHELDLIFLAMLLFISIAGKILGSGLGVYFTGLTFNESLKVGFGMIPRGEVALVIASLGLSSKLIDQHMFNAVVIMILITSFITPFVLNHLYRKKI